MRAIAVEPVGLSMSAEEAEETALIVRLRKGDERAFEHLVTLYHTNMVRLARSYVRSHEVAEEVAQDTWLAVIEGIHRFEERASLKAWIYAILANKARTRSARDGRTIAFSELSPVGEDEPAVDADRFAADGHWTDPPQPWGELTPEREVADRELLVHIGDALERLPPLQRAVIILRDIEGCDSEQACNILGISETNHRVLLHRGRNKLRAEMEALLASREPKREARHA